MNGPYVVLAQPRLICKGSTAKDSLADSSDDQKSRWAAKPFQSKTHANPITAQSAKAVNFVKENKSLYNSGELFPETVR